VTQTQLPESWRFVTLSQIAREKPNNGIFRKNSEYLTNGSGGIPVVWVEELFRGNSIDTKDSRRVAATKADVEKYGLRKGDVLFCRSSLKLDGIAFNNVYLGEDNKALFECHLIRISPNLEEVSPVFLNWVLRSPQIRAIAKSKSKTATMTTIDQQGLGSIPIPLPPLVEQQRIAGILDRAEGLRAKRCAALAKIDILPQVIFLELFGGMPKPNFAALSDVANLKRGPFGGALKKEIFVESGYKVYEQKNAIQSDFTIGRYFITDAKYRQMEDFAVKPADLIVSCSGTLGKVAVVPETAAPGVINQALLRVRPDVARVTALFLKHALEQPKVQAKLVGFSHGTGLQNFPPMSEVRALSVPAPPIELQREFARRVEAVEKLKAAQRASLAKLDALFASLQHRAFRGEL